MKPYIRFDWAAKKILREKANFDILEGFLSELLKEDISIVQLLESESNKTDATDKFNRVDILARNSANELIIVEIQNNTELDYFQRILYGTSKVITEYINEGDPYRAVKKVYSVSIVYFDLGQGNDYVYVGSTEFIGLHTREKLKLSEQQQADFLKTAPSELFPTYYLIKVQQFKDLIQDRLDEWVYFFKNSEIKKDFHAKGIQQAAQKLQIAQLEGEERQAYHQFLNRLKDDASFLHTQIVEARFNEKETIARKLMLRGLTNMEIAEDTGLTVQYLETLRALTDKK